MTAAPRPIPTPRQWADGFRSLAASGLPADFPKATAPIETRSTFAAEFRDERGNRPKPVTEFLAHTLDLPATDTPDPRGDAAFWHALRTGDAVTTTEAGPLFPELSNEGIEIWTETELAGLHALTWHAIANPAFRPRVISAAEWHVQPLQPDNATTRPWAAHVFALLAARTGDPAATLHAQTLAHNCRVATGTPDRVSALVLADAARALDAIIEQTDWLAPT